MSLGAISEGGRGLADDNVIKDFFYYSRDNRGWPPLEKYALIRLVNMAFVLALRTG